MASERAKQRAEEILAKGMVEPGREQSGGFGVGPPIAFECVLGYLAAELDRYACEVIVEASMRDAAAAEIPEALRGVMRIVFAERCAELLPDHDEDDGPIGCPFNYDTIACRAGGPHPSNDGERPEGCPLSSGDVLVRARP